MPAFETFDCSNCGESFAALAESNAAEIGACSPACHTAVAGYD
jgi:hypothetical protein